MAVSYTVYDYVQAYYMGLNMEASDYVTEDQVTQWIKEYSIKIDTSLRRKYSLPIVNANDKIFLQLLVEKFLVGRIDAIMRVSAGEEDQKYLRNRNYAKEAEVELKSLIDGMVLLESAPKNLSPIRYNSGSS